MAKLKAHGRELLRVEHERDETDPAGSITWSRVTRTYHADGKILQKYDVRFKPDKYRPAGEFYSYGWKVFGKLKAGVDPAAHVVKVIAAIRAKVDTKWVILSGGFTAPVVIDQDQIMEAVQSGESIGFCKECGHSQDGCEPDARNYKCDECGAMAVYGAEEMLVA